MNIKQLQKVMAENKVYNAWQYVEGLDEVIDYMTVSYHTIMTVYQHRIDELGAIQQEKAKELTEKKHMRICANDFKRINVNICGYEVSDSIFLRKTITEFIHYSRMAVDMLFQIINAALFGDTAFENGNKQLINKVKQKLSTIPAFSNLLQLLECNKDNNVSSYLRSFDNYIKHISTIEIPISTGIFIDHEEVFKISEFNYGGKNYPEADAKEKCSEIYEYLKKFIEECLKEIMRQVPHCISTERRVQKVSFECMREGNRLKYLSFFVDVPLENSRLEGEIKIHPLRIAPSGEIYDSYFDFDKIFVRSNSEPHQIIGYATLKQQIENKKEFYTTYTVHRCTEEDYFSYIGNFETNYLGTNYKWSTASMTGTIWTMPETKERGTEEQIISDKQNINGEI